jgi:hypothetical protein
MGEEMRGSVVFGIGMQRGYVAASQLMARNSLAMCAIVG